MPARRITIYDVAEAAGVSKSLVSLVLRGSPGVSDGARLRVQRAMEELGYRRNHAASALAAHRTLTVGLLIDDYTNQWFVDFVHGLEPVLAAEGYRLSVVEAGADRAAAVNGLLSTRPDGVVVAMDVPEDLVAADAPPVVVAGTREHIPDSVDTVANDDRLGARLATEHLVGLGHTRIGHLAAAGGAGAARHASFVASMREAGLDPLVSAPVPVAATEVMGYASARDMLRAHPGITAIFAANDSMAVGALGAAHELGLEVPGRLSVIGYDDTPLARMRLVDLTTIDDKSVAVGEAAGRMLIARMEGSDDPQVHTTVEPTLVVRTTTAHAPEG
ncbi:LacI family DNA-binding transcriptional regulator [Microbacterium sp. B2969]|uniref:LacI family DNA-binding transcriptional regulator n=1 Tax=Microbacterium alkaliflavum TaxID=3248839 RepID=A0ABW7QAG1_9MICO